MRCFLIFISWSGEGAGELLRLGSQQRQRGPWVYPAVGSGFAIPMGWFWGGDPLAQPRHEGLGVLPGFVVLQTGLSSLQMLF